MKRKKMFDNTKRDSALHVLLLFFEIDPYACFLYRLYKCFVQVSKH